MSSLASLRNSFLIVAASLLITVILSNSVQAISAVRVAFGLAKPVFATSPPGDPRLFILEQRGRIRIFENGVLFSTPFLDIEDSIEYDGIFQGILGLAFHPNYAVNGFFFVNYTVTGGDTRISRFEVSSNPDSAAADTEEVLLTIPQPNRLHNGGYMAFGPSDGYLYIGMGDGGPESDPDQTGQDPGTLLGKILRIDVDSGSPYAIPPDNPFVGQVGYLPEIWALGVREPWGMTFDRQTHDLWIADVGDADWEEINFQSADSTGGQNYGWSLMEGSQCFNPPTDCDDGTLTYPIYEYGHGPLCSINGGYVYRGSAIPSIQGLYFYSDYCTNQIWSFRYDGVQVTEFTDRTPELTPTDGNAFSSLVGFAEDAAGELYIVDWHWNEAFGEIFKIVLDPSDVDPGTPDDQVAQRVLLRRPHPNPFTQRVQVDLGPVTGNPVLVQIMDVSGRQVWSMTIPAPRSHQSIYWAGMDARQRALRSGVYFLRATQGSRTEAHTLHLIR